MIKIFNCVRNGKIIEKVMTLHFNFVTTNIESIKVENVFRN